MVAPTTATAIRDTLTQALEQDAAVLLLGDTVGRGGGIAGATAGLLERFGAERVWDLPTADRGTLAMALGLALGGRRPVVELADATGLVSALQVLAEAGAASEGEFSCPLVVRVPVGGQAGRLDAPAAALLTHTPGVIVAAPASAEQAAGLLRTGLSGSQPLVLLEDRALYERRSPVGTTATALAARTLREGAHVTVASWGAGVSAALAAADSASDQGLGVAVLDLVTLSPVDRAALGASVRSTGRLIVAGEPHVAHQVLQHGLTEAFEYLESPPAACAPTPAAIAAAVTAAVDW